ncbi:MAG: proline dehydrogenase family protein [Pseudomonadota bacterium]
MPESKNGNSLKTGSTSPIPSLQRRGVGALSSRLLAPFARRFIAGTTLTDALEVLKRLKTQGFATTLDHLGESVTSISEAKMATEQYLVMLRALKEKDLDRNISVKLTQLGLNIDKELCIENLERIVHAAEEIHGFVRVDMESSKETQATLDVIRRIKRNRAVPLGATVQSMLFRTPEDIVDLVQREIPLRLCKGAYKESPEIAHRDMRIIRKELLSQAKRLLTSRLYHGIATHDTWLIEEIQRFAKYQNIDPERFEFQLLLGIRTRLAKRILADGWRVRIYVPFGHMWLPYTWRRLRERKENMWFFIKNLFIR